MTVTENDMVCDLFICSPSFLNLHTPARGKAMHDSVARIKDFVFLKLGEGT
jgi:hypothetical protein